jgi:hypothetical protein
MRFLLEGALLAVVAAVLAVLAPGWIEIVLVMAGALLLTIGFERYAAGRERRGEPLLPKRPERPAAQEAPAPEPAPEPEPEPVAGVEPSAEQPDDEEEPGLEPPGEAPRGWRGRRPRPEQPEAPEQAPATAVRPPAGDDADEPREWNIWVLERLARDSAGVDAARDEERALLLMHLREFAGPDGMLPASFDDLVRESFGELGAVGTK